VVRVVPGGGVLRYEEGAREERKADRRRRHEFTEAELENSNSTNDFDSDGPMWNDLWTETISNDDK
jgi:hypothetical protein